MSDLGASPRGMTQIVCDHCGSVSWKSTGAINRARRAGLKTYCNRECSSFGRRTDTRSKDEKVAAKRAYDIEYRGKNRAMLKAKKADYFKRTYDPVKAAVERQKIMPRHVEYCRRPEYRAWKRQYDKKHHAEAQYGEFSECFLLVMDIRNECLRQMTDYEIRYAKGGVAKTQQRKRAYERSLREEPQVGPLGNLELGQGWQNGGLASGLRSIASSRNPSNDQHAIARGAAIEAPGICGRDHIRGNVSVKSRATQTGGA